MYPQYPTTPLPHVPLPYSCVQTPAWYWSSQSSWCTTGYPPLYPQHPYHLYSYLTHVSRHQPDTGPLSPVDVPQSTHHCTYNTHTHNTPTTCSLTLLMWPDTSLILVLSVQLMYHRVPTTVPTIPISRVSSKAAETTAPSSAISSSMVRPPRRMLWCSPGSFSSPTPTVDQRRTLPPALPVIRRPPWQHSRPANTGKDIVKSTPIINFDFHHFFWHIVEF